MHFNEFSSGAVLLTVGGLVAAVACGAGEPEPATAVGVEPTAVAATAAPATPPQTAPAPADAAPRTWTYWLADIDLDQIADLAPPLAVIDYSRDGSDAGAFNGGDLNRLRGAMADPVLVVAYLSIGETEDYQYYWQDDWRRREPAWLESENPNWAGNFKVRYWDPEWQRVIFGAPDSYLDRIIDAGFDGAYLDIIDAYEYFADRGRASAEREMVEFVRAIGEYARSHNPGFLIVPQNAPELAAHPEYLSAVDGVGVEGVYFGYEEQDIATDRADTARLESDLARFVDAGKLVLTVDYATSPENVAAAYRAARARVCPNGREGRSRRSAIARPARIRRERAPGQAQAGAGAATAASTSCSGGHPSRGPSPRRRYGSGQAPAAGTFRATSRGRATSPVVAPVCATKC